MITSTVVAVVTLTVAVTLMAAVAVTSVEWATWEAVICLDLMRMASMVETAA